MAYQLWFRGLGLKTHQQSPAWMCFCSPPKWGGGAVSPITTKINLMGADRSVAPPGWTFRPEAMAYQLWFRGLGFEDHHHSGGGPASTSRGLTGQLPHLGWCIAPRSSLGD